jgi:hypothetical protein
MGFATDADAERGDDGLGLLECMDNAVDASFHSLYFGSFNFVTKNGCVTRQPLRQGIQATTRQPSPPHLHRMAKQVPE